MTICLKLLSMNWVYRGGPWTGVPCFVYVPLIRQLLGKVFEGGVRSSGKGFSSGAVFLNITFSFFDREKGCSRQ